MRPSQARLARGGRERSFSSTLSQFGRYRNFVYVVNLLSQESFSFYRLNTFEGSKIVLPFWTIGCLWLAYVAKVFVWSSSRFGATKIVPPLKIVMGGGAQEKSLKRGPKCPERSHIGQNRHTF